MGRRTEEDCVRPAFFVLMALVASCSGAGGCSGCAGGEVTPLPGGFPQASVISNAASARLTRPGLDFISANLGSLAGAALGSSGGTASFDIPTASQSISIFNIDACDNPSSGQCVANVGLGDVALHVDAVTPDALALSGTVPVQLADLPVVASASIGPFNLSLTLDIGIGNGGCQGGTPQVTPTAVPVSIVLPLVAETQAPRAGYTKIDTANATIKANIDPSTIQICGSGISGAFASILSDFQSFVLGLIESPLESALQSELGSQLCEKPNATANPPCPTGSMPSSDGTQCVFSSGAEMGQCLPLLLGTDGHLDLGALLSKYSPGTTGGIDFVLAAGGNANTAPNCAAGQTWTSAGGCANDSNPPYAGHTPNGITLGMLGGALPNPTTACVPLADNPIPQGIPVPDELMTDVVTPWPSGDNGPDFSLALAGRFLNYAATSAYNSGVLCLGISTDDVQALSTGYVSAVIPSVKDLTFEQGASAAAMAITTRPQQPPTIAIGGGTDIQTDPLLTVMLPQFAVDFYVWSYDRYVRAFTYTADLTIPINLETGVDPRTNPTGGILPVVGDVSAANASVTNSQLLTDTPQSISDALTALLGSLVGEFLGKGLTPLDISSALSQYGVGLTIPEGGFRKLTTGTDDFLALFGDLTTSSTVMMKVHPHASLLGLTVNPQAMSLATADRAQFPRLQVTLSATEDDGSQPIEYSWWIDDQPRAAWTTARDVTVDSQYLFLQGKHVLYATARVVGHPETEGTTPAAVPFLIDVIAPTVWVAETDSGYVGNAYDFVSAATALQARYRTGGASVSAWSTWQPLAALPTFQTPAVELQVMDEAGNIGDANGLIRSQLDPTNQTASSACGCSVPGASGPTQAGLLSVLAAMAALALLARRRRATAIVLGSMGVVAATTQGCACGSKQSDSPTGCGQDCDQQCGLPNQLGLIGSYTSVAVGSDGTIWVAGYDDADVTNGLLYGDLVVGKYDPSSQQVAWQTVDGLPPPPPAGSCPPNPANTWRSGLTDPGPDVGLWTSIQLDVNGNPMVSYYDATNQALKFASSPDGGMTWASYTVMQAASSDIGRYSKTLVVSGMPIIGFLVVEPGNGGWARSRVVLATGNVATPRSASDWSFQDVVVDENTPCRAQYCSTGDVCVASTMICQPTVSGCTPSDCGASTASIGSTPQSCVSISGMATCEDIDGSGYIDSYPDAEGDYITMANGPNGLGIVLYDRTRGNLVGAVNHSGSWTALVLDGQTGANSGLAGDDGIGASLFITSAGDWHISYVNGGTEALQYLRVPGGQLTEPLPPETVDDGLQLGGQAFPDGLHIVGDDSSVTVDDSGTVRIVYQDATAGTLREAMGVPATGATHTWTLKAIAQPSEFAGFFPHYVAEAQSIENWFRATNDTQSPALVTGNVVFVSP
jgi:hypothetical protein